MTATVDDVFDRLWASIRREVAYLCSQEQARTQHICEKLLWLSQNIEAEWMFLSCTQDDQRSICSNMASVSCKILTGLGEDPPLETSYLEIEEPNERGEHIMNYCDPSPTNCEPLELDRAVNRAHAGLTAHVSPQAQSRTLSSHEAEEVGLQIEYYIDEPTDNDDSRDQCHLEDEIVSGTANSCSLGLPHAPTASTEDVSYSCTSTTVANLARNDSIPPPCHSNPDNGSTSSITTFNEISTDIACEQPHPTAKETAPLTNESQRHLASSCNRTTLVEQYVRRNDETESVDDCQQSRRTEKEDMASASSARRSQRAHKLAELSAASQKALTKRRSSHNNGKSHQKRAKTQGDSEDRRPTLLNELEHVDQDIIEPQDVHQRLLDQCPNMGEDIALFLVRLFYSMASPQALDQFKDACTLIRTQGETTVPRNTDTAAQTIKALNALDTAATVHSLLRRFHLVRLLAHRTEREKQYELEKLQRHARKSKLRKMKGLRRYDNSSSLALTDLMAEAYPHLERPMRMRDAVGTEYGRRHSSLKHMLVAGRNWHALQQVFSPGILALIPTGRECGIQNSDVERLHASDFDAFVTIVVELRGDFIKNISAAVSQSASDILYRRDLRSTYIFEKTDADVLRSYRLDDPTLVELCGME